MKALKTLVAVLYWHTISCTFLQKNPSIVENIILESREGGVRLNEDSLRSPRGSEIPIPGAQPLIRKEKPRAKASNVSQFAGYPLRMTSSFSQRAGGPSLPGVEALNFDVVEVPPLSKRDASDYECAEVIAFLENGAFSFPGIESEASHNECAEILSLMGNGAFSFPHIEASDSQYAKVPSLSIFDSQYDGIPSSPASDSPYARVNLPENNACEMSLTESDSSSEKLNLFAPPNSLEETQEEQQEESDHILIDSIMSSQSALIMVDIDPPETKDKSPIEPLPVEKIPTPKEIVNIVRETVKFDIDFRMKENETYLENLYQASKVFYKIYLKYVVDAQLLQKKVEMAEVFQNIISFCLESPLSADRKKILRNRNVLIAKKVELLKSLQNPAPALKKKVREEGKEKGAFTRLLFDSMRNDNNYQFGNEKLVDHEFLKLIYSSASNLLRALRKSIKKMEFAGFVGRIIDAKNIIKICSFCLKSDIFESRRKNELTKRIKEAQDAIKFFEEYLKIH